MHDSLQVSQEVVQQAGDADLIILEGMGRGIETNLYAQFSVDSLKLGMIKHREVKDSLATQCPAIIMVAQYAVRELVRGRVLGRPGRVLENCDHQYVTARDCLVRDY